MADQISQGPMAYGKPTSKIGATLWGTDPMYSQLPTRAGFQQAGQMAALPLALARLAGGFGAPSIAPAQREATRQFREEVMPGLMEQFAGGGSQGALTRGIQGAGSDLQSKLAALQYEKQFELQKQRQEMIPKIMELGMAPSFQAHLSNRPIQNLPNTTSGQVAESPIGQKFGEYGQRAQELGMGGLGMAEQAGARAATGAAHLGSDALAQIQKRFPDFYSKMSGGLKGLEQYTRPAAAQSTRTRRQSKLDRALVKKAGMDPEVAAQLTDQHRPMIEYIMKRGGGKKLLQRAGSIADIERIYQELQANPSKSKGYKIARAFMPLLKLAE